MDVVDLPVTVIIKAPSGKIPDFHVECNLEWTIQHLKKHLSKNYPSHPKEHQQKLIYLGRMLVDHQTLKEIFKNTYDPQATVHTIHLLCTHVDTAQTSAVSSSAQPSSSTPSEGLRHRHTTVTNDIQSPPSMSNNSTTPYPPTSAHGAYTQWLGMAHVPGGQPPPGYTQEQWMWWQQVYHQQMAYMQYMQQFSGAPVPHPAYSYPVPPSPAQPPAAAAPQPQQAARGAGGGGMVMNAAGGGGMMEDEEEEGEGRDWLDWMYIMSRLAVLLMVVYFYSSLSRFVMVTVLILFLYLAQRGWFGGRNAPNRPVQELNVPRQGQENPQNQVNENEQNRAEPAAAEEVGDGEESNQDVPEPVIPAEPERPHPVQVAWTFCTTLFTSLIPQQPGAVNAN